MAAAASNPTQQTTLIGVLFVFLGFTLVYYMLSPNLIAARTEYETQTAKLRGFEQDVTTLTAARAQLEGAKSDLVAAGVDLNKADVVVPKTESIPDLYLQLEDLVARTKFYVSDATYLIGVPSSTQTETGLNEVVVPVTFNFVASYAGIKALIQEMQLNTRPLSITQISMNEIGAPKSTTPAAPGAVQEKSYPDGSFTVSLSAYVRAESLSAAYGGEPK